MNKTTENAVVDYEKGLEEFKNLASYFVINISSPNTPGKTISMLFKF